VAYRAIAKYAEIEARGGDDNMLEEYEKFVRDAVAHMRDLFNEYGHAKVERSKEMALVKKTREQKEGTGHRHMISSARPDTVIDLKDDSVAYERGKGNDAVLVEIRKPTETFNINFALRTTNRPSRHVDGIAQRARAELRLMKDAAWAKAYWAANPRINTRGRLNVEKEIFTRLANRELTAAYQIVKKQLRVTDPVTDLYWKKWFGHYPAIVKEQKEAEKKEREQRRRQHLQQREEVSRRQRHRSGNKGKQRDFREEITSGHQVHRGSLDSHDW
jgi:hypothetical protein